MKISLLLQGGLLLLAIPGSSPILKIIGEWSIKSPDGAIIVNMMLTGSVPSPKPQKQTLTYNVSLEGRQVISDSHLGVKMTGEDEDFTSGLLFNQRKDVEINETYKLPSGKKSTYSNHCNEISLTFSNHSGRKMVVSMRAYNDGIAYRYKFPGSGDTCSIISETSGFRIQEGAKGWGQPLRYGENINHESEFTAGVVGKDFYIDKEVWFPALFEIPGANGWVLLTEAAVYGDYCASRMKWEEGQFRIVLYHKEKGESENPVTSTLPWTTPWRVAVIGKTLAPVIETNLVENLNPSSEADDMSWIKPGRTQWWWWYGDRSLQGKMDEFAREMGWELSLSREMYYDWEGKYIRSTSGNKPFPGHRNLFLDEPGTLEEAVERNIKARAEKGTLWLKCDFMDDDSQERMKDYDMISKLCLKYKIMVNWHGARLPGGERRRWPNLVGCEAVLGAEYYKWSRPTLFHMLVLPFTRNVVGPMDYTGVTFTGPATGKREHSDAAELAIAMLYENGIQYWGDSPDSYKARPAAMSFLRKCPAAWDETKFIAGYPGEMIVLARRHGEEWFIGCMMNGTACPVPLDFKFLNADPEKSYDLELHHDGVEPGTIVTIKRKMHSTDRMEIPLLDNGGFCCVLTPAVNDK